MYYVYMLRCRGNVYYTGITTDVVRRVRQHASGKGAKFTRSYPPEAIAAVWRCGDKTAAARAEYAIKKHLTHRQKERLAAAPDELAAMLPQLTDIAAVALQGIPSALDLTEAERTK